MMENTNQIFFEEESTPQWIVAVGLGFMGPMLASEVYDKIKMGEISWAHYCWKVSASEWKRICHWETFKAIVPSLPDAALTEQVKKAAQPQVKTAARRGVVHEDRNWFLHYNDAQFGPFSVEEIQRFIRIGKIHGRVFAWQDGMPTWDRLEKIKTFTEVLSQTKQEKASEPKQDKIHVANSVPTQAEPKSDQRTAPRKPLVARILLTSDRDGALNMAICRDISVGGMQVLTDQVPGGPGLRVKINVSPSAEGGISPFVAEGQIVRVLEDGRGFSFRFERLSDDARKAIEHYITSSG